jgi:anhydro-N-acetylmuramic acid kinase
MRVLGFMTGTSLDAVDMAILETDGEQIIGFGPTLERPWPLGVRSLLETVYQQGRGLNLSDPLPENWRAAARLVAEAHADAAESFFASTGERPEDLDLIGVHGQTVLHQPPIGGRNEGRTVQLMDAAHLASRLGVNVAYDFRTADVAAGGQGAPLAPVYHWALTRWSGLEGPVAVLNLGGIGNVTFIEGDGEITAFDTGPANGMIDQWMQAKTGARFDRDGAAAFAGRVNDAILRRYLDQPYFSEFGPKSLDRFDFSLTLVEGLSVEDGAATLAAFAVEAVAAAISRRAAGLTRLVVTGGGRHNPYLMRGLADRLSLPVETAEQHGWRGDAIEAEAFAYLAARTARGLPLSFPGTTGVAAPLAGGRIVDIGARSGL